MPRPKLNRVQVVCKKCNKPFWVIISQREKRKYCSFECFNKRLFNNFNLTEIEKKVLEMRTNFGKYNKCTLQSIGDIYGLTRERIRQIQNKALYKNRVAEGR